MYPRDVALRSKSERWREVQRRISRCGDQRKKANCIQSLFFPLKIMNLLQNQLPRFETNSHTSRGPCCSSASEGNLSAQWSHLLIPDTLWKPVATWGPKCYKKVHNKIFISIGIVLHCYYQNDKFTTLRNRKEICYNHEMWIACKQLAWCWLLGEYSYHTELVQLSNRY
jgi:hypothetical protein